MERAKLANTKKTYPVNTKSARAPLKTKGHKPKPENAGTAGKLIWRRTSSSGAIAGVGSVSANAIDRRHLRRNRGARSSTKRCDEGSGAQTLGPPPSLTSPPVPVRSPNPQESRRGIRKHSDHPVCRFG
jgi:hypothetical protein